MAGPRPTTRRDFLRGRALAGPVDSLLSEACELPELGLTPSPRHAAGDSLITVSRRAMGCTFEIVQPAGLSPNAIGAASAALDEIDRLEDQMTVYRDSSEVSRINCLAAATPAPVEERLFELFQLALRLTRETDGAFDIAAGALIECWGFVRGPRRVPEPQELIGVLEQVGSQHVVLDRAARTIRFRRPGLQLNLGAIGKGYALDRAALVLRHDWEISAAILHGGQSSVYAIGAPSHEVPDADGWLIGITHPLNPGEQVAAVRLRDAALGTSGATIQYFQVGGRRFGHILDPRTGWPAEGLACVSVIAPTAAQADALSTAWFILGPDRARDYCTRHPDSGAVLVSMPDPMASVQIDVLGRAEGLVELTGSAAAFAHS